MLLSMMTEDRLVFCKRASLPSVGALSPLGLIQTLSGVSGIYLLIPAVFMTAFFVLKKWNDVFKPIHND